MDHFLETRNLLQNSTYYYAIAIGMDNRYSYVSPNYDVNFSFINDSLLGKPFYITLHPDDIKICQEAGAKCFEKPHELFPATLRKHDGKGGFIFTQWELKAIFDEDGNPEGIFCIGYNITEYVDTRNQLKTANIVIHDKDDQLNEIGFIQSHVVRKPLANIIGLINILKITEGDTEIDTVTNLLLNSARELDEVIRDITAKTG